MGKKKKKARIRDKVREFFEMLPLPVNYLVSAFLLILVLASLIPDPLPLLDEIIFCYLTYHSISVTKEKRESMSRKRHNIFSRKRKQKGLRQYEGKMSRIFSLFEDIKDSLRKYSDSEFLKIEGEKLDSLLPKVEKIKEKIERLDNILVSSDFQEDELEKELYQLSSDLKDAETDNEKQELKSAREHAEKCLSTVKNLSRDRNILVARVEKFYYLLKDTHSKIIAKDLTEKEVTEDISNDINRLLESIDSFDQAMKELGEGLTTQDQDPVPDDLAVSEETEPPPDELEDE